MKLIVAIVQNEDVYMLSDALMEAEFSVTKLSATGGFLKMNNVTMLIGTQDDKVQNALDIIQKICKSREQVVSAPIPTSFLESNFTSYTMNVKVGGATVFVLDVEQFAKF